MCIHVGQDESAIKRRQINYLVVKNACFSRKGKPIVLTKMRLVIPTDFKQKDVDDAVVVLPEFTLDATQFCFISLTDTNQLREGGVLFKTTEN